MRFSTRPDRTPSANASPAAGSRQRAAIVAGLAVVAVLAVIALGSMTVLLARLDDRAPVPVSPPSAAPAAAQAGPPAADAATTTGPAAVVASTPPGSPSPADELGAGAPGTVPVCGVGRVPTHGGGAARTWLQQRHAAELEAASEQMTRSADPRVRAVALLLGPTPAGDRSAQAAVLALAAASRAESAACPPTEPPPTATGTFEAPASQSRLCILARAAAEEASERHRRIVRVPQAEALRRLGETSTDPAVVATALQSCIRDGDPAQGCRYALVQRWAQLDPGNGWTALESLGSAIESSDRGAIDAALSRMAAAPRFEAPERVAIDVLAAAIPAQASPGLRAAAAMAIAGRDVLWSVDGPLSFARVCSPLETGDPTRRQLCGAAADALAARADTLMLLSWVPRVGRATGWDAQRVRQAEDEHWKLMAAMDRWSVWGATPPDARFSEQDELASLGCGQVDRVLRQLRARAAEGEVAALRRLLAADGIDWRTLPAKPR